MLETTTDTALARRESIADGLRRSARRDPDRVALRFGERSWTYAALDAAANRVARRLAAPASSRASGSPPTAATPMRTW